MVYFEFRKISPDIINPGDISQFWLRFLKELIQKAQIPIHDLHGPVFCNPIIEDVFILAELSKYMEKNGTKVVIVEYEYVDKEYLKDFQQYHLSCYQHYKKTCVRLHLFSAGVPDLDFSTDSWLGVYSGYSETGPVLPTNDYTPLLVFT
jgi:hypothetical protein